ncbi:MAG TPA: hypothetical protein VJY12_09525, partial [Dysgonamonadaceae bacterium]|nr:hypothetical protein [Dysgonamonadaceae bacterium]
MKKLFAILAILGVMSVELPSVLLAQDSPAVEDSVAQSEQVAAEPVESEAAPAVEETSSGSFHQVLKIKFIEGGAGFMSIIALVFILGLAFALERIIYLSLADVDSQAFLKKIGEALSNGDVEGAKDIARETRGPIASIIYQGLLRLEEGPDVVERSIVSYGGVQSGLLERNLSWITL